MRTLEISYMLTNYNARSSSAKTPICSSTGIVHRPNQSNILVSYWTLSVKRSQGLVLVVIIASRNTILWAMALFSYSVVIQLADASLNLTAQLSSNKSESEISTGDPIYPELYKALLRTRHLEAEDLDSI